jgi:acyl-CoA synthetase (AMP-forming)/AMP-acid ligase II
VAGPANSNFAARLLDRLGPDSRLIDAPTGDTLLAPEILRRVTRSAAAFAAFGLRAGDRVVIGCGLSPASTIAYLAAIYAGLVAVPIGEKDLPAVGEAVFKRTRARLVWSDRGVACTWASQLGAHLQGDLATQQTESAPPVADAAAPREPGDLALLMSTSGSTGTPRLVKVTHGNLIANTEAIVRSQALGTAERAMLILPLSYCFGASVLHSHLHQGGGVVFDSRFMFPDKVLQALAAHECTSFAGVPTVYNILLRRSNIRSIALPRLRRFLQAGGSLDAHSIQQMRSVVPHAEFLVMYGQTEATARISCLPPGRLMDKLGSVGLPLDNLALKIVDDAGRELATGDSGEIWVKGESISAGYYDEADRAEEKFNDGWLKTGDIAYRDADGFIWIKGRRADFIKMRGIRLGFAEIEAKIAAIAGVFECAAATVPHPEAGEALALFVVPDAGVEDLATSVRRKLPRDWLCESVTVVTELPKTAAGKLARAAIADMARDQFALRGKVA